MRGAAKQAWTGRRGAGFAVPCVDYIGDGNRMVFQRVGSENVTADGMDFYIFSV